MSVNLPDEYLTVTQREHLGVSTACAASLRVARVFRLYSPGYCRLSFCLSVNGVVPPTSADSTCTSIHAESRWACSQGGRSVRAADVRCGSFFSREKEWSDTVRSASHSPLVSFIPQSSTWCPFPW